MRTKVTKSKKQHKTYQAVDVAKIAVEDTATQKKLISKLFRQIMEVLWLDLSDDSLIGTPDRVAKMYVDELFWWLRAENFPKIMTVQNKMDYDQMLVERNIKVNSACEHHRITINGVAHVAYIPKDKIIGLSKLNRIVDYYSRRPQIQERLTAQIHSKLVELLWTEDVAVIVDAVHFCVVTRGIKDVNSSTVTSKLWGIFRKDKAEEKSF